MLYGESGAGKSSLVNAGLIPAAEAEGFDFRVDRIRVQPHLQHELVVERIAVTPDSASFLPSSFAGDADGSQIVLSIEAFRAQLDRALSMKVRPLLIFDQFEELITLFEEARGEGRRDAREAQLRIVGMLVELLLHQTMPVKLVFSFREDYLAQVKELLALSPELVNQSLRLTPPPTDALYEIIRDPFEKHPGHFGHELMPELAHRLSAELASRSPSGAINLSEMQIVCLRLWESSDPEALLEHGGVQAVLEDYLEESLNRFPQELHYPAVALLSQLVTATGVRNIVAREDLIQRVRSEEPDIPEERVEAALGALESETRLVRRERRGDLDLFEISSEFLVPWIGRQRADRLRAREQARLAQELEEKRRRQRARLIQRLGLVISGLFVAAAVLAALAVVGWRTASNERDESASREFAARALVQLRDRDDPVASVSLAAQAVSEVRTMEAEEALRSALVLSRRRAVLRSGSEPVRAATFSPDGSLVVTGGDDGTAQVWETATGRKIGDPITYKNAVRTVAFSPSGGLVATGSDDGTARLWNIAEGRPVGPPLRHNGSVGAVAFSPDGRFFATAGASVVKVWETTTARLRSVLRGNRDAIYSVAFSPDSRRIVTGGADNTARLWSVNGRASAVLEHGGSVYDAVFDSAGRRLLTASADGSARVWDVSAKPKLVARLRTDGPAGSVSFSSNGRLGLTLTGDGAQVWDWRGKASVALRGHDGPVNDAAFSPNGRLVVTGGWDETARIWDASTGRSLVVLRGHDGPVNSVAFGRNGRLIMTASDDGTARLWDAAVGQSIAVMRKHASPVYRAVFAPDGKRFVTIGYDQKARVWDTTTKNEVAVLPGDGSPHAVATFSPNGSRIVTGSFNGRAAVWDAVSGDKLAVLRGHRDRVNSAAFSPDGSRIVTGSFDGTAAVWDAENGDRLAVLHGHDGAVNTAAFSPDGSRIVTASSDGTAAVWDAESAERLAVLRGHDDAVNAAAFSADGRRIVTASSDTTARLWDGKNFAPVATLEQRDAVWGAAFSTDGELVMTVGDGNTVRVWDGANGKLVAVLLHPDSVTSAVFSPDGRVVASAGSDGRARVWDAVTGVLLSELRGHSDRVNTVDFSQDGRLVLTSSDDKSVRLFVCEACRRLDYILRRGNWTRADLGVEPRKLIRLLAQAGDR